MQRIQAHAYLNDVQQEIRETVTLPLYVFYIKVKEAFDIFLKCFFYLLTICPHQEPLMFDVDLELYNELHHFYFKGEEEAPNVNFFDDNREDIS